MQQRITAVYSDAYGITSISCSHLRTPCISSLKTLTKEEKTMIFRDKSQNILGKYSKITVKVGKFISSSQCNCMIALMLNDFFSLMCNQFVFRLQVERKCNFFVMSFIEYIHWKSPAQILVALFEGQYNYFKTITIFIVSTTKLRTGLALSLLSISVHAFSKKKRWSLHMPERLVIGRVWEFNWLGCIISQPSSIMKAAI